jgi:hypothetical protein
MTSANVMANEVERPCKSEEIIGTWEIVMGRNRGNIPDAYQDLVAHYQVLVYKSNNFFQRISADKKMSDSKLKKLMKTTPLKTYSINNGIIKTLDVLGNMLEQYSCFYVTKDATEHNLKKGMITKKKKKNKQPVIMNTFEKKSTTSKDPKRENI